MRIGRRKGLRLLGRGSTARQRCRAVRGERRWNQEDMTLTRRLQYSAVQCSLTANGGGQSHSPARSSSGNDAVVWLSSCKDDASREILYNVWSARRVNPLTLVAVCSLSPTAPQRSLTLPCRPPTWIQADDQRCGYNEIQCCFPGMPNKLRCLARSSRRRFTTPLSVRPVPLCDQEPKASSCRVMETISIFNAHTRVICTTMCERLARKKGSVLVPTRVLVGFRLGGIANSDINSDATFSAFFSSSTYSTIQYSSCVCVASIQ